MIQGQNLAATGPIKSELGWPSLDTEAHFVKKYRFGVGTRAPKGFQTATQEAQAGTQICCPRRIGLPSML